MCDLIRWTTRGPLREKIHDLYYKRTSPVVHVRHTLRWGVAGGIFRDTLRLINELYEQHGRL